MELFKYIGNYPRETLKKLKKVIDLIWSELSLDFEAGHSEVFIEQERLFNLGFSEHEAEVILNSLVDENSSFRVLKDCNYGTMITSSGKTVGGWHIFAPPPSRKLTEVLQERLRGLFSDEEKTQSNIDFHPVACTMSLEGKVIKFTAKWRRLVIKKLWENRKVIRKESKTSKKKGLSVPVESLAASVDFVSSSQDFAKNKNKKEEFISILKGIKKALSKFPKETVRLDTKGEVQLVIFEF